MFRSVGSKFDFSARVDGATQTGYSPPAHWWRWPAPLLAESGYTLRTPQQAQRAPFSHRSPSVSLECCCLPPPYR